MNTTVYIIYALLIAAAVSSYVYLRIKRALIGANSNPKTFEEMLKWVQNDSDSAFIESRKSHIEQINTDKWGFKSSTLHPRAPLEELKKENEANSTEQAENNGGANCIEIADHHVHGVGPEHVLEVKGGKGGRKGQAGLAESLGYARDFMNAGILILLVETFVKYT